MHSNVTSKYVSWPHFSWTTLYNSRYTALTTLGIRQEAEQIMANVFYSTFLNVFLFLPRFLCFPTFFKFFLERFLHLCIFQRKFSDKEKTFG